MSLTSFLDSPEVKARFRTFRPTGLGSIPPTLVKPLDTQSASLVGTAFDYLLRFEIERIHKSSIHKTPWIAQLSFDRIHTRYALTQAGRKKKNPGEFYLTCEAAYNSAKASYAVYVELSNPSEEDKLAISGSCIDLARFDIVHRIGRADQIGQPKRRADIDDLMQLLSRLCIKNLLVADQFWLNPNFGLGSDLLNGADADFIAGDVLVEVKTTIRPALSANTLDQLLGYYILSRFRRHIEPEFPKIEWCAVYFSRQAHVAQFPVALWTQRADFNEFEGWFHAAAFRQYKESHDFLTKLFI